MEQKTSVVYSNAVVEFVTVAVQYCIYLEQGASRQRSEFLDTMLKMLPLLYLKAQMLPPLEDSGNYYVEQQVREEDYDIVRTIVADIMGGQDDYLDVFVEDMKYSDTPIRKNISEDLADIYQDVRNFVGVYKQGMEEAMYEALAVVRDNFELYWGQTLVNTMRALHEARYNQTDDGSADKENS